MAESSFDVSEESGTCGAILILMTHILIETEDIVLVIETRVGHNNEKYLLMKKVRGTIEIVPLTTTKAFLFSTG